MWRPSQWLPDGQRAKATAGLACRGAAAAEEGVRAHPLGPLQPGAAAAELPPLLLLPLLPLLLLLLPPDHRLPAWEEAAEVQVLQRGQPLRLRQYAGQLRGWQVRQGGSAT